MARETQKTRLNPVNKYARRLRNKALIDRTIFININERSYPSVQFSWLRR